MKVAVLSDIHANLEALQTVLTYLNLQNITQIICLGDAVGYGACPNECVVLIREYCDHCVLGNHDFAATRPVSTQRFNEFAEAAILWTRRQLTAANKIYLNSLPYIFNTASAIFVHSTPANPRGWDYVLSPEDAWENFHQMEKPLAFIGHSHLPVIFSEKHGAILENRLELSLSADRYIINVGSVGQPRDGNPNVCFVVYEDTENIIEYVRLPYDIDKSSQQILDAGLPFFLAQRLFQGR